MQPGYPAPSALRAVSEHAPAPPPRAGFAAALAGFSENTQRAIRPDFRVFDAWCRARQLPSLPAAPATVVAFVDDMAASRAPATVRRYAGTPDLGKSTDRRFVRVAANGVEPRRPGLHGKQQRGDNLRLSPKMARKEPKTSARPTSAESGTVSDSARHRVVH